MAIDSSFAKKSQSFADWKIVDNLMAIDSCYNITTYNHKTETQNVIDQLIRPKLNF